MRPNSFYILFVHLSAFFLLVISATSVYGQQCSGADGNGYVAIGVTTAQPGTLCANKDVAGARLRIQVGNILAADIATMFFSVDWGDGSPADVINTGFTNFSGNDYEVITPTHFFPVTGANVDCSYQPTVTFGFGATICEADYGSPPPFRRYNTDDPNGLPGTGDLQLISPNGTSVFEVCEGATTIVTFNDQSTLNCTGVALPNNALRTRRFIYGTAGSTIANVLVDGSVAASNFISAGMPFNQTPSTGPLNDTDATTPETGTNTAQITIPSTAVAGQSYFIQMDYWNQCNPFSGGDAPVSAIAEIRVVAQPTPPTAVNQTVCKGTTPNAFTVTGVPAGATVHFYRNNGGVPGTLLQSSAATTLPINNYDPSATDSLQTNIAGYYKVWVSYTPNVVGATNCETQKVPVTIIIRSQIPQPGAINSATTQVCADGSTIYNFDETSDSPTLSPSSPPTPANQINNVGGPTQYTWTFSNNANIVRIQSGATNKELDATFNTAIFGAGTSTIRQLRVSSSYASGTACPSANSVQDVTIFKVSNGGIISPATGDICSGDSKDFQLTGTIVGVVQRWEVSINGGPFNTDADFGALTNPPSKIFLNATTSPVTYIYRAVVKNGACSEATSATASFTVYPIPPKPTITSNPVSGNICNDGSDITLTSDNVGGVGGIFRWYKLPDITTPVLIGTSDQLVLNTVSQSGDYRVEVRGATPLSCASQMSDPITVVINALPEVTSVSGGGAACDGNPAPDMIFEFSGGAPYNFTIDRPGAFPDVVVTNHPSNTYTLTGQIEPGSYDIIALSNPATGCNATALGGSATVTSAGGAPVFDAARVFTPTAVCDDGGATTNPTLTFSLVTSVVGNFILTYAIDALPNRTVNFTVDGAGTPTTPIEFSDIELDAVGAHTITLISIETPSGCFGAFNDPFNFTVNGIPSDPTGPVDATVCSSDINTATVSVDDPNTAVTDLTIDWYTASAGGTLLLAGNHIFDPAAANQPAPGGTSTYYAEMRNSVTGCISVSRVPVTLTSDANPGAAVAGSAISTCDLTSTLSANAPLNGGVGTWSVGTALYYETFSSADNNLGITGPNPHATSFTHPSGKWSVTVPTSTTLVQNIDWIKVDGGRMSVRDVTSEVVWRSSAIDISTSGNVSISAQASETGSQTATEYIRLSYIVDGGGEVQFGNITDDGAVDGQLQTFTVPAVSGSTLEIIMRARNTADADRHLLDNVIVVPSGTALPGIADVNNPNSAVSNLQIGANTFTWTITSALGACTASTSTMTITRDPQPVTLDITQNLCETVNGTLRNLGYDLTVHNISVANNVAIDRAVTWFTDAALTIPVADPTNVDIDHNDIFYARVVNTVSLCNNVSPVLDPGSVTFNVSALAVANTPSLADRSFCEDVSGTSTHAGVNLATKYNALINGSATITYYPTQLDAQNSTNQIMPGGLPDANNFTVVDGSSVFARVVDGCVNIVEIEFLVHPIPTANPILDQSGNTGTINVCRDASTIRLFQVTDENLNDDPGSGDPSTYTWTIPPQFARSNGGGATDALVLLRFPNAAASPGLQLTVRETSARGCPGPLNTLNIIVDDQPTAPTIMGASDICADQQSITYAVAAPNVTSSYSWSVPGALGAIALGQGTGSITINAGPDTDANATFVTSYLIEVTEINATGCSSTTPDTHPVRVHDKPTISPVSQLTICSGSAPNESIIMSVPSSTYTWEAIFVSNSITGVNVGDTGTGDITDVLTNTSNTDGSVIYRITAFGPDIDATIAGDQLCQGQQTTLTVRVEPVPAAAFINSAPRICTGGAPNIAVTSPTTPTMPANLKFNVSVNLPAGITGSGVAVANQINLTAPFNINSGTLNNSTDGALTVQYTITPMLSGCTNGPPSVITVVVDPTPKVAINNIPPTTICNNGNVNIQITTPTTSNNASDLTFDVAVSSSNAASTSGTAYTNLANQTFPFTINGTLTNNGNNSVTVNFLVTPKLNGCTSGAPVSTSITVEPIPGAVLNNNTPSVCDGGTVNVGVASLSVPTVLSDLKYDVAVSSSNTGATGGSSFAALVNQNFPGTIGGTLTNSSDNVVTITYTITPKLNGCANGPVQTTTVKVEPTPRATILNSQAIVCSSGNVNLQIATPTITTQPSDLTFDLAVTSDNPGFTSGTAFANLTGASYVRNVNGTLINTSNSVITVTFAVTPKLNGCSSGAPEITTVMIEPVPVAAVINNRPVVCDGDAPNITVSSPTAPTLMSNLSFDVAVNLPAGVTGTGVAVSGLSGATAPFAINAGTLANNTNSPKTVVYVITPILNGCANGNAQTVNVVVEPTPEAVFVNNAPKICTGGTPNITVTSNTVTNVASNLTFDVSVALPAGVTGTLVAGNGVTGASAPFSIASGVLTNTTNSFQTVVYTITPKLAGCTDGPQQIVTVIVEPEPQANLPVNNAALICNNGTPDISVSTPTTPSVASNLTFDVAVSMPAGVSGTGVAASGLTGASATFAINSGALTNATNGVKTVAYTITPKLNGCANGPNRVVSVNIDPTPQVSFTNNLPVICSEGTPDISFISSTIPDNPALLTFDVTVNLPAGLTGTGVAANGLTSVSAPFSINSGTLVHNNATNLPLIVTYTITPKLAGCPSGTQQTVTVTVRPDPAGLNDNTSVVVCSGDPFAYDIQSQNIDMLGNGVSSKFTFTVSSSDETNVPTPSGLDRLAASTAPISGTFMNKTSADVFITYRITPISNTGLCEGLPFDLMITIHPQPKAPTATTSIEVCSREAFSFNLQNIINDISAGASNGGNTVPSRFRYTVSSSRPDLVSPGLDRVSASTAPVNDTYVNQSNNVDVVITYRVTPFNLIGNCEGDPFDFKVIVHPEPVGTNFPDPICSDGNPLNHDIQTQITNNLVTSEFHYVVSSNNINVSAGPNRVPGSASSAPITDTYVNTSGSAAQITYVITPISLSHSCVGQTFNYVVNVDSRPVGAPTYTNASICSDALFTFNPQNHIDTPPGNSVPSTFTYTYTLDPGLVINGTLPSGTGQITARFINKVSGNNILNATFTVTPRSTSVSQCLGDPFDIIVPVLPEPVLAGNLNEEKCSDNIYGKFLATESSSVGAASYDVSAIADTDLTGTPTSGTSLANNALQNNVFTNATSSQKNVLYTVVPKASNGCSGDSKVITFKINPEPVLLGQTISAICSKSATNVTLGTNGISVSAVFTIINKEYSTGGPFGITTPPNFTDASNAPLNVTLGNDAFRNDDFINKSNSQVVVRYTIQPRGPGASGSCLGNTVQFEVPVNPEPVVDPALNPTSICSDLNVLSTNPAFQLREIPSSVTAGSYIIRAIDFTGLIAGPANIGIGTGRSATSLNGDTYTNTNTAAVDAIYTIAPVSSSGCIGEDLALRLRINPAPDLRPNLDKTVCYNSSSGILLADNSPTTIAATSYDVNTVTFDITKLTAAAANSPAGTNTSSLSYLSGHRYVNATNQPQSATYKVKAVSAAGCKSPERDIVLTVEPEIKASLTAFASQICSGTNAQINIESPSTASAGIISFNYSVSGIGAPSGNNITSDGNASTAEIDQILDNNTNNPRVATYKVTPRANTAASGVGCIGSEVQLNISIEPKPKLTAVPGSRTVCEGVSLGVDFTSTTVPTTGAASLFFQLTGVEDPNTSAAPGNITGFVTSYPTNYTTGTDVLNDVLLNSAVDQQSIRYLFTPSFTIPTGTCTGDQASVNITISPRPTLTPFTVGPKCSGEPFSVDFSSSITEADLSTVLPTWTFSYSPSGDPDITGASSGAGTELSQVVFNKNADPAIVTYAIKAKSFNCESNTIAIPVTIYPIPKINGLPASVNVCEGGTLNIPLLSNANNTTYTWTVDDESQPDLSGATDQLTPVTGPLNYILHNTSTALNNYVFRIIPQVNTTVPSTVCYADSKEIVVNVAPKVDGRISTSNGTDQSYICEGSREAIQLEFDGLSLFDVIYKEGANTVVLTKQGPSKQIQVRPSATTVYELVSVKDAFGCITSINDLATVTVFSNVNAEFDEGTIPSFVAGSSIVTFTNTSSPLNGSDFTYAWTFGDNADPKELTSADATVPVTYSVPGLKEVTLTVKNNNAEAQGLVCGDTFKKTIEILLPPLVAGFKIVPLAACFPVNLEVVENTSTGDTYKWQVIDQSGNVAATALSPKPIFRIVNPGTYDVFLEASSSITGQTAFAQKTGIEVYDNPLASIEARPTTLFVPDTELVTFNFSTGANFYMWDFDDGTTSEDFEPKHQYLVEGKYQVTLVAGYDHGNKDLDGDGMLDGNVYCYDTARRDINARDGGFTKIPNAFTPSRNGPTGGIPGGNGTFNDVFLPITKGVAKEDGAFVMQIYDRWGTMIFETRNQNVGWDGYDRNGNLVPAGVYVFKLQLRLADGQRTTQVGDVTVIR